MEPDVRKKLEKLLQVAEFDAKNGRDPDVMRRTLLYISESITKILEATK